MARQVSPDRALATNHFRRFAYRLSKKVVEWFRCNGREFPWRTTSNPFHLLIAEALLRQTQAERVVEPYLDLVSKYPNPEALAEADVNELRQWFKPFGLVRRADRLIQCARILISEYRGSMPNDLNAIEALPGLGRYNSRAILCLGFGIPAPMIDEGSGRVLRRVLGHEAKGPAYSDKCLMSIAERIIPTKSAREFNFGLIDVAAAFCHPKEPDCARCPLARLCNYATESGRQGCASLSDLKQRQAASVKSVNNQ
ncbi:MAG: hypothetical protein HYU86_06955 [Chloroflexi bacterium]|nr:hypothetical protein [Chloroflexota bacterium]